jgi:hypothetical protein
MELFVKKKMRWPELPPNPEGKGVFFYAQVGNLTTVRLAGPPRKNLYPSGGRRRAWYSRRKYNMPKRVVYHVVPDKDERVWKVKREGAERSSSTHNVKGDALEKARELAQNNPLSQVKIHGMDGKIQEERTYGQDPEKYPG